MKILITGYKGFIGQNMVNALKDDHELTFFEWEDHLPDLTGHDWCIHLGAITSTAETDIDKVLRQNYDFSRHLLNKCNEAGVNLQYASSAGIYGNNVPCSENNAPCPLTPYAWSKYLFERYVENLRHTWKIKVQGFRYFNVYGPLEDHKGDQASPYHKFEKQAKETGVIKLFEGSKNLFRDFVHVDRVIEVHKQFFNIDKSGIWNLGTGSAKSFYSVAQEIADKYNAKIEYIPMPTIMAPRYQRYTQADLTILNKTLAGDNTEPTIPPNLVTPSNTLNENNG